MNLEQLRATFHDLELRSNFFSRKQLGKTSIWDIVRADVWWLLQSKIGLWSVPSPEGLKPKGYQRYYLLFKNVIAVFVELGVLAAAITQKKQYICFTASRTQRDERYVDSVAQDILEELGRRVFVIESCHYGNIRFQLTSRLLGLWCKLCHFRYSKNDEFTEEIVYSFKPFVMENELTATVNSCVERYKKEFLYYKFLFKLLKPKHIFLVQNGIQKALIAAANANTIKLTEIQHGLVNIYHPVYSYPSEIPVKLGLNTVPNFLLTFSEFWCKNANMPGCKNISIGNNNYYNESIRNELIENKLLFILADIYENDFIQLIHQVRKCNENIKIIAKLHPNQYSSKVRVSSKFHNSDNVEVIGAEFTTSQLLPNVTAVVVIQSTVSYEALQVGVPVFIYKIRDYCVHGDLFQNPIVKTFQSAEELCRITCNPPRPNNTNMESFFRAFSPTDFRNFISTVTEG